MSQFEPKGVTIEREQAIIEEIRKSPDLHHNALIKRIVPKYMAKKTFEKTRDNLIEKNVISCTMKGNKKYYQITKDPQRKSLLLIERITQTNFQYLRHEVKKMRDDFHHKDVNEKISKSIQMLSELLQTDNGFTILDSVKDDRKTLYKDEHLQIQEMISKVLNIIAKDQDEKTIFPSIVSSISFDFTKNFEEIK